ncbi:Dienelactone hydrolase [Minicystis rosea]|nr:Dienelactone hydrolase [Minicystis rosea]
MPRTAFAATLALVLCASGAAWAEPSSFGAIAYARDDGRAGYATRRATQQDASANAKSYCKSASCQVVAEFHDACAFFAVGGPGKESVGKAAQPKDAEQSALRTCAAQGGKDCRIVAWGCSKPAYAGQPPRDEWDLVEEEITIPAEGGATLVARVIRPPASGPLPLVVLNHGSPRDAADRSKMTPAGLAAQARRFAVGGWVAVMPLRRGYGASTGGWAESYGSCNDADYVTAGRAAASDIASTVRHFQKLPYVDKQRVVSVGVSAGGFGSIAFASLGLPGVAAVLNFAGGRGSPKSDAVCSKERLLDATKVFGRTSRVPTLWVYADNDHFFGPQLAQEMLGAFKSSGGQATFVKTPKFGEEGHYLFSVDEGLPIWKPIANAFLGAQRLPLVR